MCCVVVKTWMPRDAPLLAEVLADARVWKLKDASAAPARPVWSTGKSSLDARLPGFVWIAPPHEPYAPALAQSGIELKRLLIVRPPTATEALWAAEQALSSGVCAAVLLWLKGTDDRWLRRLKLAAEAGGSLGVLFRPERHRFESSPANLRIVMSRGEPSARLDLLKVQGGRPGPVDLGDS